MRRKRKTVIQTAPPGPGNQLTADEYIQHWKARRVWTHLERPKHLNRLIWCANQVVGRNPLDVGCAFGHSTVAMARFHPDAAWCGCDFSEEAADTAMKMQDGSEIMFFAIQAVEDLARLPYPFSTIIASDVIEHVQDDRAFLAGLVKAALNRVVLTTPAIDAQDPGHVRLYTDETLGELLKPYRATVIKDKNFFYVTIEVTP